MKGAWALSVTLRAAELRAQEIVTDQALRPPSLCVGARERGSRSCLLHAGCENRCSSSCAAHVPIADGGVPHGLPLPRRHSTAFGFVYVNLYTLNYMASVPRPVTFFFLLCTPAYAFHGLASLFHFTVKPRASVRRRQCRCKGGRCR